MDHLRVAVRLLAGTGLLLLAGFAAPHRLPPGSIAEPAKVGFSYLSASQLKELWRVTQNYAMAEVLCPACGPPPPTRKPTPRARRDGSSRRPREPGAGLLAQE